jgi:undecaprenyl diphosphate synthase
VKNDSKKIPEHVAIIMDGNGRWAKKRLLPRAMGHSAGAKNVESICKAAWDLGVKYLTVYAFSTENWTRSDDEVSTLMKLLKQYLEDCKEKCLKNNMRVRIIGDIRRLPQDLQDTIVSLEEYSKQFDGLQFQVALNYGGRDDIVRAVKKISDKVRNGEIKEEDISEALISKSLDTGDIPDPDLLIRTSGELRISNFMLWQLAYTEMYFTDVYWPDFDKKELEKALLYYADRDRRFGGRKNESK